MRFKSALIGASLLISSAAHANYFTATIDTLQIDTASNGGYVKLTGLPVFDGTGCTGVWASGDLDDQRFMIYLWPLLMSAKNNGKSVTVNVSGCLSGYPRITWAQVNAT